MEEGFPEFLNEFKFSHRTGLQSAGVQVHVSGLETSDFDWTKTLSISNYIRIRSV